MVKPRDVLPHLLRQVYSSKLETFADQILKCGFSVLDIRLPLKFYTAEMRSLILAFSIFQVGVPNPVSGDGGPKGGRNKCRSRQHGSHLQNRAETGVQRWRGRGEEGRAPERHGYNEPAFPETELFSLDRCSGAYTVPPEGFVLKQTYQAGP